MCAFTLAPARLCVCEQSCMMSWCVCVTVSMHVLTAAAVCVFYKCMWGQCYAPKLDKDTGIPWSPAGPLSRLANACNRLSNLQTASKQHLNNVPADLSSGAEVCAHLSCHSVSLINTPRTANTTKGKRKRFCLWETRDTMRHLPDWRGWWTWEKLHESCIYFLYCKLMYCYFSSACWKLVPHL